MSLIFYYITIILKYSHGSLVLKKVFVSGLLLGSVLAKRLDDSFSWATPQWESPPSVPRIEIPFRCGTWTGLSVLLCWLNTHTQRNRRVEVSERILLLFFLCVCVVPITQNTSVVALLLPRAASFTSPVDVDAHRPVMFAGNGHWTKPGEGKLSGKSGEMTHFGESALKVENALTVRFTLYFFFFRVAALPPASATDM